jgi:hypothetical protein
MKVGTSLTTKQIKAVERKAEKYFFECHAKTPESLEDFLYGYFWDQTDPNSHKFTFLVPLEAKKKNYPSEIDGVKIYLKRIPPIKQQNDRFNTQLILRVVKI